MQSKEEYEKQLNAWMDGSISDSIIDSVFLSYKNSNPEGTKESFKDSFLATLFPSKGEDVQSISSPSTNS